MWLWRVIIFAIFLPLAACGANAVISNRADENNKFANDIKPIFAQFGERCRAELASHALDPIRSKVPFDTPNEMPAEALVIHAKAASVAEKKAILAYVDARQRCMSYFKDTVASLPWPADMSDELKQRLV
jgi:hypothetical protein